MSNDTAQLVIDPRLARARVAVHTDRIRQAIKAMMDSAYDSTCALEALGFHGVAFTLDASVEALLADLASVDTSAIAATKQGTLQF